VPVVIVHSTAGGAFGLPTEITFCPRQGILLGIYITSRATHNLEVTGLNATTTCVNLNLNYKIQDNRPATK
jgi:hypothetical protein